MLVGSLGATLKGLSATGEVTTKRREPPELRRLAGRQYRWRHLKRSVKILLGCAVRQLCGIDFDGKSDVSSFVITGCARSLHSAGRREDSSHHLVMLVV